MTSQVKESLGFSADYLEEAEYFKLPGFSNNQANVCPSNQRRELVVSELVGQCFGHQKGGCLLQEEWMLEKTDLKKFDFDALLNTDDLKTTLDKLLVMLDGSCALFVP